MRTIASVGSWMAGSGTLSTRTSRLPCQVTAFMCCRSCVVPADASRRRDRSVRFGSGPVDGLLAWPVPQLRPCRAGSTSEVDLLVREPCGPLRVAVWHRIGARVGSGPVLLRGHRCLQLSVSVG
jgi:hypothetical protein